MQTKEIMTEGADCISPECSVQEAAMKMARFNVGMLAVCDQEGLKGLLTDRDIAVRAVSRGADVLRTRVADVMSRDPACCREDDDIKTAAGIMEQRKVRRLPILNQEDKLVGIVSLDDLGIKKAGQDVIAEILEAVAARHGALRTQLSVDFPAQGETVASAQYTLRLSAPEGARRVEVAVDDGQWRVCRQSGGHWWYDWTGYESGEHEAVVRAETQEGSLISSEPHEFFVKL